MDVECDNGESDGENLHETSDEECNSDEETSEAENVGNDLHKTNDKDRAGNNLYETSDEESDTDDFDSDSDDDLSVSDSDGSDEDTAGNWTSITEKDVPPPDVPFEGKPGPKLSMEPSDSPIDYVKLFFTEQFIDTIVIEVNRYAEQWIQTNQFYLLKNKHSRVHKWMKQGKITREEMYAFLATVFNMGLNKKPSVESYWDMTHESQAIPWFSKHFSRDRFQLILKFLHFADNSTLPEVNHPDYKLYKIKPVLVHFQKLFKKYYEPNQNLSMEVGGIKNKSLTPNFQQQMKKGGPVQVWCVCDASNSYTSGVDVYFEGERKGRSVEHVTHYFVLRLLRRCDLLLKGYHLCVDRFFSSPALFMDLYEDKTKATGAVNRNRKGLPKKVVEAKLGNQELCEMREGPLLSVAFNDNGEKLLLLSTGAKGGYQEVTDARGKITKKPCSVTLYNKTISRRDLRDLSLLSYLVEKRSQKWTTKVALSIFGRALLNAFILYKEHSSNPKLKIYEFLTQAIEAMVKDFVPPQKGGKGRIRQGRETGFREECKLQKVVINKRRNCVAGHTKRKRTRWECPACNVGLCPACFTGYHKKLKL